MEMRYRIGELASYLAGKHPGEADLVCITNLANQFLVTPRLHTAQAGFRPRSADERRVVAYWEGVYRANEARNRLLERQLADMLGTLNAAGIVPLLLTGAAALAEAPSTVSRMVPDLDIMLAPDEIGRGQRALTVAGYVPWEEASRRHTAAKLVKRPHIGLVHIHRHPPDLARVMSAEDMMRDAREIAFASHRARLPSSTDRLCYLIGHDMLEEHGLYCGEINLRHLLDAVEFMQSRSVDHDLVHRRFSAGMRRLACTLYEENLRRLFGMTGLPDTSPRWICRALFHRQMLRSEERFYAAFDQTLLVFPLRASWWLRRQVQSALRLAAQKR
ncbi:nucleotidyltransferase family protein [Nitratireductor sp. ZSWI3]|uniref:nucleotidyltransferase family protein n=1 Tax=Nitratireductor sp. ZSWI3 TaxID=2966359 RepID=UPI0021505AF0|nr:nucleotidyltransferase family protein [Nitratireductor sp. ZSWI3]MCR4267846.1 nucleotidyltransferase family protein [Nitratireductor sp. ZSWI3]